MIHNEVDLYAASAFRGDLDSFDWQSEMRTQREGAPFDARDCGITAPKRE